MEIKLIDFGYRNKPARAYSNDAGADVFSMLDTVIPPHRTQKIPLGFGLELPEGFAAFVGPRSGLSSKGISCEMAPIDSSYRGECHAIVINNTSEPYVVNKNDRIGQLIVVPIVIPTFVNETTSRGDNGFGSTGK